MSLEFTREHDGFYALLGSVVGATATRVVSHQREDLNGRTIDRVILIRRDMDDPDASFHICLLLSGENEAPQTRP